jgi:hypothetical protein
LSNNKLISLPQALGQLSSLQILDLCHNNLKSLPESLGNLKSLILLKASNNELSALPNSIGSSSSLKTLDVESNHFSTFPETICELNTLHTLDMAHNMLAALPEALGNLTSLEELDLKNNFIKSIPKTVLNMHSLKAIEIDKIPKSKEVIKKMEERGIQVHIEQSDEITLLDWFLLPEILANILFVIMGLLYNPYVPFAHVTLFWCALLIAGNVGNVLAILFCTYVCSSTSKVDFSGAFSGLIIPNGFIYVGELVWFLIVSLDLLGLVGMLILIQFVAVYCTCVLQSAGILWLYKK